MAPTGTPEFVNVVSVHASYTPLRWLNIFIQPSLAVITNSGNVLGENEISFECVLGAQVKFTKIKDKKKTEKIALEEKDDERIEEGE